MMIYMAAWLIIVDEFWFWNICDITTLSERNNQKLQNTKRNADRIELKCHL